MSEAQRLQRIVSALADLEAGRTNPVGFAAIALEVAMEVAAGRRAPPPRAGPPAPPKGPVGLWTIEQAAEQLGISDSMVRKLNTSGRCGT